MRQTLDKLVMMLGFMIMFSLVVSAQVDTFLREIFGSQANLEYAARSYFNTEDLRHSSAKIKEPWPKWEVIPSDLRHPVELLWWRLTRLLGESNRLPLTARRNGVALPRAAFCTSQGQRRHNQCLPRSPVYGFSNESHSIFRSLREHWLAKYATDAKVRKLLGSRLRTCFETGDGHYLPAYNSCVHRKSLDKFDPAADYPLDLNVAPSQQLESVKRIWQSADFLISHDVFEHLEIPEIGMINLARLLRPGGALLWSAPLLKEEHGSRYGDWQRYTTQRVRKLVDCAGFEVVLMHGLGSPVASLAYLYGITPRELSISELTNHACDASHDVVPRGGKSHTNLGCRLHRYTQLIAIVTKKTDVKFDSYMQCVMGSVSARQMASWWPEAL